MRRVEYVALLHDLLDGALRGNVAIFQDPCVLRPLVRTDHDGCAGLVLMRSMLVVIGDGVPVIGTRSGYLC
jgi:hypothetical protein